MDKSLVKSERLPMAAKPERLPYNRARQQTKFEGRIDSLKGHIYDCADSRQANLYVKTTREIAGYVATAMRNGNDVKTAIETLTVPKMKLPNDLPANTSAAQKRHWEKRIDEISKKEMILEENMKTLFSVVWGQVSDVLRHRIQALADFKRMNSEADSLALLVALRDQAFNFQSQKDQVQALQEAVKRFYLISQGSNESCQVYMDRYENGMQVIKHIGGKLPVYTSLVDVDLKTRGLDRDTATADEIEESEKSATERQLAMGYILGCDRVRYGKLIEDLENQHTQGIKSFPKTLSEVFTLTNNWKCGASAALQKIGGNDAAAFMTNASTTNKKKKNKDHITCYKCGMTGHYLNECTSVTDEVATEGKQFLNSGSDMLDLQDEEEGDHEFLLYTNPCKHSNIVSRNWVLLDNQSTVDVFQNKDLLTNVRDSGRVLRIHCNAGIASTTLVGDLPGYGEVWLYENGIANILSLSRVKEKYHITYDSHGGNKFIVHLGNGLTRIFTQSKAGLYYYVARGHVKLPLTRYKAVENNTILNTVEENKAKYSKREVLRATLARRIQKSIGHPSLRKFIEIVENNQLPNFPIVKRDILAAEDIFGGDLGCLKGKTVRRAPTQVKIPHASPQLPLARKKVVLSIDIMYVNDIPFLMTISRDLQFGSAQALSDETYKSIYGALHKIIKVYLHYGFCVTHILGDGQFENLDPSKIVPGVTLNIVARSEHVPKVERYIRTVKEWTWSVYNSLPFKRFPTRLLVEIVYAQVFWLNSFPSDSGISRLQSPRMLVTGNGIDYNLHCKLECGSYVQTHEDHNNNMAPRTIGALALRPTGNVQGGFYFYNLTTGCIISRRSWNSLPMPVEVIHAVHELAEKDKASKGTEYNNGTPETSDADESFVPGDLSDLSGPATDDSQNDVMDGEIPGVDNEVMEVEATGVSDEMSGVNDDTTDVETVIEDGLAIQEIQESFSGDEAMPYDGSSDSLRDTVAEVDHADEHTVEYAEDRTTAVTDSDATGMSMADMPITDSAPDMESAHEATDIESSMDERYGSRSGHYNLRPRRERNLNRWNDAMLVCHDSSSIQTVDGLLHSQHYVHQGLKLFGKAGEDAITTELKQLHSRQVLEPRYCHALTQKEKDDALPYLMFLKEKHTGQIKGRVCADGWSQRTYMQKEDTSSPTVAIESLFISVTWMHLSVEMWPLLTYQVPLCKLIWLG